jgi:ATP-dependent DNA helicase RecQ
MVLVFVADSPVVVARGPLDNWASAYEALHRYFGFTEFREGQSEVIKSVLAGHDSVVVMPTGGGKSLCYQLPAMVLDGVTLVVSPLIALMKDQVDQLVARGLPTTFINSSLAYAETNRRLSEIRRGLYKLVYVAPERFRSPRFMESIQGLRVKLMAVDEAHCISHWGHDFRPDYLRLKEAAERLSRPPIVALTATATIHVRGDISNQLGLRQPGVFVAGFDRPNLRLRVLHLTTEKEKLETLKQTLRTGTGSGIIYAATRKSVEQITAKLKMAGLRVEGYHAGMTEAERTRAQNDFMRGKVRAIIATNAFGMGIDKADIRFVIHYHLPGSIEAYYQEIGRGGRDGEPADCILLFNYADTRTHQFFIEGNHPAPELINRIYHQLFTFGVKNLEVAPREIAELLDLKNEMAVRTALSILEKAGHIDRGRSSEATLVVWLRMKLEQAIDAVPDESPEAAVIRDLIFNRDLSESEQVEVSPALVAGSLGLPEWQVRRALDQLTARNVIAYRRAYLGKGIRLLDDQPAREPRINKRELAQRAAAEQWQLRRMIDYAYYKGCLRQFILTHFGDPKKLNRCGNCSSCTPLAERELPASVSRRRSAGTLSVGSGRAPAVAPATEIDRFIIDNAPSGRELRAVLKHRAEMSRAMNSPAIADDETDTRPGRELNTEEVLVVRKILSCVARMNGRFGKGTVAAVLRGSKSKQVQEHKLDQLSTYGLLRALPQEEISAYIKALIEAGCIEASKGLYPTVTLSEFGREVMHERAITRLNLQL